MPKFSTTSTMAKLALTTLTLLIVLFITLASAEHRHPNDLPDGRFVSIHDPSITLPEPDSKRTILLPSEKPDSHPPTLVDLDHHKNETDTELTVLNTDEDIIEEKEEAEEENKSEMPFLYRDLRPVWTLSADQRRMFILRHHPHRRPHPHHQIMFRQFDTDRPEPMRAEERSYGNDMLVADPEMEKRFEEREGNLENDMLVADPEMERRFDEGELDQDLTEIPVAGGGRRHAPSSWVGLHFGLRPRFPDHAEHEPFHHQHHHHEDEEHHHEHRPDEEHRNDHHHHRDEDEKRPAGGGGLVKRFRKFLHNIDL